MEVRYATALPLIRAPGRGAATVQDVMQVQADRAQKILQAPVPVMTTLLPVAEHKALPAATAQAASAYKAAKGAFSVD